MKGAYWDSEIKRAQERGLGVYPVYTRKLTTDVSYLACAGRLFGSCDNNDPATCKHKNCGLSHFRAYWQALKRHEDGTKAFDETFMTDLIKAQGSRQAALSAWEAAYMHYVKSALK